MRLFNVPLALALFATSTLGQTVGINIPTNGSAVTAGSTYTVQLSFPIYIENDQWLSVALGLLSCGESGCPAAGPSAGLGPILASAPYAGVPDAIGNIVQNLTVTIPTSTASGAARLNVAGFEVAGDSYVPGLSFNNVTLIVE